MYDAQNVLVVNSGSSSVKYQVISFPSEDVIDKGQRERVGVDGGDCATHTEALVDILNSLPDGVHISAVGHRVVHGGETFRQPVLVDEPTLNAIDALSELAPLHNPANLQGITAAREALPEVPHVAVFDTAFFASLTPQAYTYAIPRDIAAQLGVRKYGFHGTSHQFVTAELERHAPDVGHPRRVVSFHLGNGSSVAAVRGGHAVDTSMGFTPLAGLVMGTRSGDLDPSVVVYLQTHRGLSPAEVDEVLNRESGLLGLSGYSDMRDLFAAADAGDPDAELALEVWVWRARHYLGAYIAQLGGIDAIVFTGGIGENQATLRARIVEGLEELGIVLDTQGNESAHPGARRVSPANARVHIWVIPTNEELQIARLAHGLVSA